jgi:hypothetical protein
VLLFIQWVVVCYSHLGSSATVCVARVGSGGGGVRGDGGSGVVMIDRSG